MRCIFPSCENTSRTRGLCHAHYQSMRAYVRAGNAVESDLEERGLLLPKGKGGSPPDSKCPTGWVVFREGSPVRGDAEVLCPVCQEESGPMSGWDCSVCSGQDGGVTEFARAHGIRKCADHSCANPVDIRGSDGSDGVRCDDHKEAT